MIFPLRDESESSSIPFLTIVLIAINIGVFVYQAYFGPEGYQGYVLGWGLIPVEFSSAHALLNVTRPVSAPVSLLTAMFMHGGIGHLLSNMWFLWIFGDNVEHALGRIRFVFFYLLTGVVASVAHIVANPGSTIPLVGASGAIAGVLGAYFLLFPRHRISTLVVFFVFLIRVIRIPAFFFLGFWFLFQVLLSSMGGSVAWWAHIGGFVAGLLLAGFFLQPRKQGR